MVVLVIRLVKQKMIQREVTTPITLTLCSTFKEEEHSDRWTASECGYCDH